MHFVPKSYWYNPYNTDGIETIKMAFHLVSKTNGSGLICKVDECIHTWAVMRFLTCMIFQNCLNLSNCIV